MQTVSATLTARLQPGQARNPCIVVELYAADYIPDSGNGHLAFDPADAEELFSAIQITWNGNEYRQELKKHPDIQKHQGKTPNSCSLSFSNLDLYLASLVVNDEVDGLWCVVRYIERDITDGSIVTFVGRCDPPGDIERSTATLTAKGTVGAFNQELPPDSPLQDITFKTMGGTFQQPIVDDSNNFFRFPRFRTAQWSAIPGGREPPLVYVLGRVQLDTHGIIYADIGTVVKVLKYVAFGKLYDMVNIRQVIGHPYSQPLGVTKHLGEADGVGTQTVDPLFPDIGQTFPGVAYIGLYVTGSSPNAVDPEPYIVCVAIGEYALPDGSGDFVLAGPTDNPGFLWRHLLSDEKTFNHPVTLIDDASVLEVAAYCDEMIFDATNAERRALRDVDFAAAGTDFINYRSTGVRDTEFYRDALGLAADDVFARQAAYEDWGDIIEPPDPVTIEVIPFTRKRYTVNVPYKERGGALDALYDNFYQAFGGFHVTGGDGRLKLKVERPVDNTRIRTATIVGATSIPVQDVTPWLASLSQELLIGAHLATSEVRVVTAANTSTAGNSVTLAKAVSGTITATLSGATLSGGNNVTAKASGTVTIGGTITAGNTVELTIEGVSVEYTINSSDTTGTVAAQLADLINADPTLKRIVSAAWAAGSPTVVTISSKYGTLTVAALANAHSLNQEVMRVAAHFDNSNTKPASFRWPQGSKQKSYNQVETAYVEASDDFAIQPYLRLNDTENQEKTKKKTVYKLDLTAVDNYNQAYRRSNIVFSKIVEGNKFATWKTKTGIALLLEEGDVVCVSDDGTGLVNYPVRLEEIAVSGEAELTLTGRQYSSTMFSDEAAQHTIKIPSTLVGAKPLDVTNFIIDDASISGIRLKWEIDPNETRVLTYRLERKDGAAAYVDAATVTGDTWTDHNPLTASVTKWRIVALAGGGRESETPTEVTLDVTSFYGDTEPVGLASVRDFLSTYITVTPPVGMNAFGLASIKRTRIRKLVTVNSGPTPADEDFWFEGGSVVTVHTIPTPVFKSTWDSITFEATYEFATGLEGDTGAVGGGIFATSTQATAARENIPAATTLLIGGVTLAEHDESTVGEVLQSSDPRIYRYFNPKHYGAVGSGAVDDAPAFQQAYDAAEAAGGGTILVPPGLYEWRTPISVNISGNAGSIRLKGFGTSTQIRLAGSQDAYGAPITGVTNLLLQGGAFLFQDIQFIGTPSILGDFYRGISAVNAGLGFDNVAFWGCGVTEAGGGVVVLNGGDLYVKGLSFNGCAGTGGLGVSVLYIVKGATIDIDNILFPDYGILNGVTHTKTSTVGSAYSWIHIQNSQVQNERVYTVNDTTDVLTSASHGFENGWGMRVRPEKGGASPSQIDTGAVYYVINKTANTFQLSLTPGGAAIDILDTGTGIQYVWFELRRLATRVSLRNMLFDEGALSSVVCDPVSAFDSFEMEGFEIEDSASRTFNGAVHLFVAATSVFISNGAFSYIENLNDCLLILGAATATVRNVNTQTGGKLTCDFIGTLHLDNVTGFNRDIDATVLSVIETNVAGDFLWNGASIGTGTGDVSGPASAVDDRIATFDGTTGKLIQDSGKVLPSGSVVGTTDTQTLTNKSFDAAAIASGVIAAARIPSAGVLIYLTTNYSVPNATLQAVPFASGTSTEIDDTNTFHDGATNTSRFTVPSGWAGVYRVTASGLFASAGGTIRGLQLRLNGTLRFAFSNIPPVGGGFDTGVCVTGMIRCVATDYIELLAFHDAGAAINLQAVERTTQFSMEWMRA